MATEVPPRARRHYLAGWRRWAAIRARLRITLFLGFFSLLVMHVRAASGAATERHLGRPMVYGPGLFFFRLSEVYFYAFWGILFS